MDFAKDPWDKSKRWNRYVIGLGSSRSSGVSITRIHSYLVHPSKHDEEPPVVGGVELPQTGKMFAMLKRLMEGSRKECDIAIVFRPSADGKQQNACRALLLAHLKRPTVASGRAIALRLQGVTTKRSGLGLMFIITAKDQHGLQLLLSRFPAETGITAQEQGQSLSVQFIEQIFMKSVRTYKSVLYEATTIHAGFWTGLAVDRQMIDTRGSADYWIKEFLHSDLKNTPAAGTKRVAAAIRTAIDSSDDPQVRQDLISAAQLMAGRHNQITSGEKIVQDLGLRQKTAQALRDAFPRPELFNAPFRFDVKEFDANLLFRSVELDNGAMLTAENSTFEKVFHPKAQGEATRFSTEGRIVDTKLRKSR
jgi:hypothetical protein